MAEARRVEEGAGARRDARIRNQTTTDNSERTKADHLHSSTGPLSSLRAVIKRTRTNSQCDHTRDRRRPEITIVSAEPLAGNGWFSGSSVVYPPPPPPPSGWSTGIQAASQPPPSYDQVIQEKTKEEHTVKPIAAPRRTACTSSSATQTDPVRENGQKTAGKRPAGKKPQKPPRPSLPKPVIREPTPETAEKADTKTSEPTNAEDQSDSKSELKQLKEADTCTRSVTVHWDIPEKPLTTSAAENTPSPSDSEQTQRPVPVPLPRKKRKQAIKEEVKVQTLVKFSESSDDVQPDQEEVSSNKYLEELLEVFATGNECEEFFDNQSDEALQGEDAGGEMSTNNSQRNILARIQAFESQANEEAKPEPRPRKPSIRPPVAAKPSVALKPQFNPSTDNNSQNVPSTDTPQNPSPTPRPVPPKKLVGLPIKEELEALQSKGGFGNRPRPVLTRADSIYEEVTPEFPPTPPTKPVKEALKPNLNINNHNSTTYTATENENTVYEDVTPQLPPRPPVKPVKEALKPNLNVNNHNSTSSVTQNEYVDGPTNVNPVKPLRNGDSNEGSFSKPSVTRRPTTIRVPSKSNSFSDSFQDSPPPLPAQKPVGHLNASVDNRQSMIPVLPSQDYQFEPEPMLPPRRVTKSKTLPPRPPPAKTGPGRPPPPSFQSTGRSHSASWDVSPTPKPQNPHRNGPVLPPRPNPGHRLYNKYTLELSHGIAALDYHGSNTGELSFQKNEVLLLLEDIDHNTFECQVGDARGRVNKSLIKVITPLASSAYMPPPQDAGPAGQGLKVQALHDFHPEGQGELGLKAGDVVTNVEQVDSEWYQGTCRGSSGFFPINYVKVLSSSPRPLPERKVKPPPAEVSGPRCRARFDFEGEQSDELTFSEGDVIQLKEYIGQEWARGQIGSTSGIFPLNFVEIIEDLPPPTSQQRTKSIRIPLPGMVASPVTHPEAAKPAQPSQASGVEWVVAMYDYDGSSEGDLAFHEGDRILITQHVDAEWSCGRLNGREGIFPIAFVESSTAGQQQSNNQPNAAAGGGRARAMFDFTSDCDEELSLRVGDIITNLEPVDDEWFLGDLRGKRALVPRNYVQLL